MWSIRHESIFINVPSEIPEGVNDELFGRQELMVTR